MALPVTHVYRGEDGEWTLLHRHVDPLMSKTAPEAVVQYLHGALGAEATSPQSGA